MAAKAICPTAATVARLHTSVRRSKMTEFSSLQSSAVIFPLGELPVEAHFSTCIVCRKKTKTYVTDPEVGLQIQH